MADRGWVAASRVARQQPSDPQIDQVRRAGVPDEAERDRRRDDQRGKAHRGRGDVDERAEVHARHGDDPGEPPVLGALRDDVEHRRPRDEQQRERSGREEREGVRIGHGYHSALMRRYHVTTFGCQMNAHDSERIKGMLEELGLGEAVAPDEADVLVFNTCTIREKPDTRLAAHLGNAQRC